MGRKRIVTIGGGTGSFTLLSGLRKYPIDISAIVSMADDGGSTGTLRDELGVLPPGDVRQCLVALSDTSQTLRELLSYRFENGGLKGHNFGNIFLSALEKISGSFENGINEAIQLLNVKGEIIPATNDDARLFLQLKSGRLLKGEDKINKCESIQQEGFEKIFYDPEVRCNPRAVKNIMTADLVSIGPGGLYTSIIPCLLIDEVARALRETKAIVAYNCNLTNVPGQSEGFTLDDYVNQINGYIGIDRIDIATYNTQKPNHRLVERYENQRQQLVQFEQEQNKKRSYQVVGAKLLSNTISEDSTADSIAYTRALIRHDSDKLAGILMRLVSRSVNAVH